jgi:sporulation protein YlmC with PRC-barrel domain
MVETEAREEERKFAKQILGKTVLSKSGKKFGEVGDIIFETKSGELIHVVLKNPTAYAERLELEKNKENEMLVPYSAVLAVGDYLVVSEQDIV